MCIFFKFLLSEISEHVTFNKFAEFFSHFSTFLLGGGEKEIFLLSGRFVAQFFLGHGRRRRKVKTGARRLPPHGSAALTSGESRPRNRRRSSFFFHFGISFVWKFVDRIDELSICPNDELIKMIFQFLKNWKKIEKKSQIFFKFFCEFFVCFPILKIKNFN